MRVLVRTSIRGSVTFASAPYTAGDASATSGRPGVGTRNPNSADVDANDADRTKCSTFALASQTMTAVSAETSTRPPFGGTTAQARTGSGAFTSASPAAAASAARTKHCRMATASGGTGSEFAVKTTAAGAR